MAYHLRSRSAAGRAASIPGSFDNPKTTDFVPSSALSPVSSHDAPSEQRARSEAVQGLTAYNTSRTPSPEPEGSRVQGNVTSLVPSIQDNISQEPEGVRNALPAPSISSSQRGRSMSLQTPVRTSADMTRTAPLSGAQRSAVARAEQELSQTDKARYEKRMRAVGNATGPRERTHSPGEGTSKRQGKTVDPRNWGAVEIPADEMDPEIQWQAFRQYATVQAAAREELPDDSDGSLEVQREMLEFYKAWKAMQQARELDEESAGSQQLAPEGPVPSISTRHVEIHDAEHKSFAPVHQVVPDSYLGRALQLPKGRRGRATKDDPSDSSDSSSDSSDDSSNESPESDSSDSDSDSSGNRRRRRRRHGKTRSKKNRKHDRGERFMKPEKPEAYDGRPDAEVFHKFIRQITRLVEAYKLDNTQVAVTVSDYLKGDAYKFYANTIDIDNPSEWSLRDIFIGLFNYCFTMDFRVQQRDKLRTARQNGRTVREFAHELQDLFRMTGYVSREDQVDRLFNGLHPKIQASLWEHKLSPATASWDEMLNEAIFIETAHKVTERHKLNSGSRPDKGKSRDTGHGGSTSGSGFGRQWRNLNSRRDEQSTRTPVKPQTGNPLQRPSARTSGTSSGRPKPKPNSDSRNSNNLSEREKTDLRAAGKCFLCKEPGHMARNCPQANHVPSERKGKPPGLPTYSIGIDSEHLRTLAESTVAAEELEIAHLSIGSTVAETTAVALDDRECDSDNESEIAAPVDFLGLRAEKLLDEHAPYTSLGRDKKSRLSYGPFMVHQTSDSQYVILSGDLWEDVLIDTDSLRDPMFNLVRWFQDTLMPGLNLTIPDSCPPMGDVDVERTRLILNSCLKSKGPDDRFDVERMDTDNLRIHDDELGVSCIFSTAFLDSSEQEIASTYLTCAGHFLVPAERGTLEDRDGSELNALLIETSVAGNDQVRPACLSLNAVNSRSDATALPLAALQRNAFSPRDFRRLIPEPIVIVVKIAGQPARTLLDSGSLGDFISARFAHQVGVQVFELEKPLPLHLAVQGSRAKISTGCKARLQYQSVSEERYFDVANLLNYDMILGTPFMFQHRVMISLNPTTVEIGSAAALPIEGKRVRVLESRAAEVFDEHLELARQLLRKYAEPICKEASDSPLPPLRAINHQIPLKEPAKIYHWRPSRCPDAHRASWIEKRDAYLQSGRWQMSTARNTSPMLLLTKPGTGVKGIPPRLRVVFDLRERNQNTEKVVSPLPDMEGILRRMARKPYRSLIDGKDAYEQIRVEPSHVERTAMTTPDGNMVSLVMQQGDCNAVATYQTLMNHIFGPYIGRFMDVYLDDIVIYSDTLEEHIQHVKIILDILKKEQLYLSATKLKFLASEVKVLGRIVDGQDIRMDPDKVDSVLNWKVPTSKELLRGFLGSVGYLADDIATVRIPMGVLTSLTGTTTNFQWDFTHQRAFDEIKQLLHDHREHRRVPLDYSDGAPPIWLVTDGSLGGIAGVVTQGADWRTGRVAAFFSAKLSSAQMNYPVHEIEMLAGIESMQRHRDILLGCPFTWVTDHKGLTHFLAQRNLSGRQARWLEKISEFNFRVEYVPGVENVLADALSRMYSNDRAGTVRAASEYVQFDDDEHLPQQLASIRISAPVYVGLEAMAITGRGRSQAVRQSERLRTRSQTVAPLATSPVVSPVVRRGTSVPAKRARVVTKAATGGRESVPAPPVRRARKEPPAPAETGRPETATEFSKRIKRVVLHGPREQRQEGGNPDLDTSNESLDPSAIVDPTPEFQAHATNVADVINSEKANEFLGHLSSTTEGIDLPTALKDRYGEDPFFAIILANPNNYKNFRVSDGLVFLKEHEHEYLCIPNIQYKERSVREITILHAHQLCALTL
ncbi:hypothetical protein EUX98_g5724 [Antrodiella citrinella]|uniref:RNA-directed DNA polymerase n=1 Tax=Antrodiella citrinella TaxID=2447956 RepID=A0A4S4MQS8_9APHY|nr:hypothetical protein EUX98_g5724 [Antrodiella citrinella]